MNHNEIWQAIDKLAEQNNLSPSALAKRAGLDPTSFNKSKRIGNDGRKRWPSMESIVKILTALDISFNDFIATLSPLSRINQSAATIPLLGFAKAGRGGYFDDYGYPIGSDDWDGIMFPDIADPNIYAIEVSGDSMLPAYRDGDRLIVSPASDFRRGDRIVVKTKEGEIMVKELKRQSAQMIELKSINPEHDDRTLLMSNIDWIARVLWVSQ